MKKTLLLFLALLALEHFASAQAPVQRPIQSSASTCQPSATDSTACVFLQVNSQTNTVGVEISGTFSATLQFVGIVNSTLVSVQATASTGGAAVTSTTATGTWTIPAAGYSFIGVRCSAYTSGVATVSLNPSQAVTPGSSGSGAVALSSLTGSAAAATLTETAAGNVVTFAGVETGNLTYPNVFQNTNSANSNSSGALLVNAAGTSTGQVPFVINSSGTGHLIDAYTGATVTNGVLSGGVLQFFVASGGTVSGSTFLGTTYRASTGANAVTFQSGVDSTSNSTLGLATFRGADNSNAGASAGASALTIRAGNLTGTPTNLPGAEILVTSGLGTGNSTPTHVKIQTPSFSSTSGTTAQTAITDYVVHKKAGSTTTATATTMFNIPVAANQTIGVEVLVHVETTQATPQNCSTTQRFVAVAQNTSATVTQQTTADTIIGTICSTGTLTLAAAFSAATPAVFSVTPSWTTIVPTGVIITVEIHNLSQQDIALL